MRDAHSTRSETLHLMDTPIDTNDRAQRESRPVIVRRSQSCVWDAAALGVVTSADLNSRGELKGRRLPFQMQEKPRRLAHVAPRADVAALAAEIRQLEKLVEVQAKNLKRQETIVRALCDFIN